MRKFYIFLSMGIFIILLSNCNNAASTKNMSGEDIFMTYCAVCHGADGKRGANGAKDLTQSELPLTDRIMIITRGKGLMTPFGNTLSDEQIKKVAKFTMKFSDEK